MKIKQYITLEQWNELSEEEKEKFFGSNFKEVILPTWKIAVQTKHNKKAWVVTRIDIGQLIEYLGDDWKNIHNEEWGIELGIDTNGEFERLYKEKELIDVLWEATKHKLKI